MWHGELMGDLWHSPPMANAFALMLSVISTTALLNFTLCLGVVQWMRSPLPIMNKGLGSLLTTSDNKIKCRLISLSKSECLTVSAGPSFPHFFTHYAFTEHPLCVIIGQVTSNKTMNKTCSLLKYEASNIYNYRCKVNKGLLWHF